MAGLAFMVAMFCVQRPGPIALLGLCLLLVAARSAIPFGLLARGLTAVALLALLTFVFQLLFVSGHPFLRLGPLHLSREGAARGALLAVRLIYLALVSSLVSLTTSPIAMTDGMERLLAPLGSMAHELAMVTTVSMRFLPILALEAERIAMAQMARGARLDQGWPAERLRACVSLFIPLLIRAFNHADELALSMEARCYGGQQRTRLRPMRLGANDALFTLATSCLLGAILWLG